MTASLGDTPPKEEGCDMSLPSWERYSTMDRDTLENSSGSTNGMAPPPKRGVASRGFVMMKLTCSFCHLDFVKEFPILDAKSRLKSANDRPNLTQIRLTIG